MKVDKRSATTDAGGAGYPFAAAATATEKCQSGLVPSTSFNPVKQKVEATGTHAFQASKAGDQWVCSICVLDLSREFLIDNILT
jgi:hypothetical protein